MGTDVLVTKGIFRHQDIGPHCIGYENRKALVYQRKHITHLCELGVVEWMSMKKLFMFPKYIPPDRGQFFYYTGSS